MSGRIVLIARQRRPKDKSGGRRVTLPRFLIHTGGRRKGPRREALATLIVLGVAMAHCGRSSFADHEVSRCYPNCALAADPVSPTIFSLTAPPALFGLTATSDGGVTALGGVAAAAPVQLTIDGATTTAPASGDGMFLVKRGAGGETAARVDAGDSGSLGVASLTADGTRILTCGYLSGTVSFDGRVLSHLGRQAPLIGVFDGGLGLVESLVMPTTIQNGQCKGVAVRDGLLAATGLIGGTIDPGGGVLTAAQDPNAFIAVYQASTFTPQWQVGLIATRQVYAQVVSLADDGGAYAGGRFEGNVDFAPPALASAGAFDGYLIRYGPTGAFRWSTHIGGLGEELVQRATPFEGGVCLCGHSGSAALAVGATTLATSGDDVFVSCYDDTGALRWARALQAVSVGQCGGALVDDGRLVIGGTVGGGADFGAGSVVVEGTVGFAAAYDADGGLVGVTTLATGTTISGLAASGGTIWASGTFSDRLTVDGVEYVSDAPNSAFIAPVRLAAP